MQPAATARCLRRLDEVIHVKCLEWYVAPGTYLMDVGDDGSKVKRKKMMVKVHLEKRKGGHDRIYSSVLLLG